MENMTIRIAETKDIDRILMLLSQVLEVHANIRPDIFKSGTTKYSHEEIKGILDDEKKNIYVADIDGNVVGYAFCELREPKFTSTMIPFSSYYIDDLCVDETYRGKHIGEALFEYVKKEASRLGCREITLAVWEGNEPARAFYDKMKMHPKETIMELKI